MFNNLIRSSFFGEDAIFFGTEYGARDLGGFRFRGGGFPFGKRAFGGVFGEDWDFRQESGGKGGFLETLRSDGGEGPIFLVEKGAEKPQRWGEF